MSEQWFIVRDNQKHGPYSAAALRRMATSGQLLPIDLVIREGMARPVPATQIKGLFAQSDTPPPLPTQTAPPQLPEATPPSSDLVASAAANDEAGFLLMLYRMWPRLKFWEKATGIGLLLIILTVFFWVQILQPATGGSKSWLEILLSSSVVAAVVTGVFSLLSKFVGAKAYQPADAALREGLIESEGQFVGLDVSQWLFTLHLAFLSGLMGAIVAGFLFGSVSLWINGFALVVIGVLIAWLSRTVEKNVGEHRTAFLETSDLPYPIHVSRAPDVAKEVVLSRYLGLSTLPPALLAMMCGCLGTDPSGSFKGIGQHAIWIYFVYGLLVGLPSIHVLQWVARHMSPIRQSAGVVIAGGYLAMVFLACVIVSSVIGRKESDYIVPENVRAALLGTWNEVGEQRPFAMSDKAKIEFTRGGQALVSKWDNWDRTEDYKYRFTSQSHLQLFEVLSSGSEITEGSVEVLSDTDIVVKLHSGNKKFTKSGSAPNKTPGAPAVTAEVADTLKQKLAGEWSKVNPTKATHLQVGGGDYISQTVFFSKTGTIRYSGTKMLAGRPNDENQSGKFEVIGEDKIGVGPLTISFDFISDDEFVAGFRLSEGLISPDKSVVMIGRGGGFHEVDGKFRRVKPVDFGKLKQQIVGRWAATFPDGTLSFEFDTAGNATVGYPGQRPLQNTFTITDNTIRIRHLGSDSILTLTVVSIFDNEATFKVQGANDTVFRRMK